MSRKQDSTPDIETYPLMLTLAASVRVNREQGMFDGKRNTALVMAKLREGNFVATDDEIQSAKQIHAHFAEIIVMDKLAGTLVKRDMAGRVNNFNSELNRIYYSNVVNCHKDMPMISSLPYSHRIAVQREFMAEFRITHARNGFIGKLNERMQLDGQVIDVRRTSRYGKQQHYVITMVTPESQIVKFFMFPKKEACSVTEQQYITVNTPQT